MFLTLDIGTTAVKAALFNEELKRLGLVTKEYALLTPRAGFVELSPKTYIDGVISCIRSLLQQTGIDPKSVKTITAATQGETLIPVDAYGCALHNAVVWLDGRAVEEAALLSELYSKEEFYKITGVPELNAFCPVAKLLWFKNHLPEIYEKAAKFLLLEDYILFYLTGQFVTNPSLMCTTGYFDIRSNTVWDDILLKTGLDTKKIPEIKKCGQIVGGLTAKAASALGLSASTMVTTGAMDQAAASLGAGAVSEGSLSETTGTCLAVGTVIKSPDILECLNSYVPVYVHAIEGFYLKIVISQTAGIVLKWFKDEFCKDFLSDENAYARIDALAGNVPALSKGVTFFPHFAGSYDDCDLRGAFLGLSLETGRDCFARAILEGVGYMLKESLALLGAKPGGEIRSFGGGAKSDLWSAVKADICGSSISIMAEEEAASLGAAMLGAVAIGHFKDFDEIIGHIKVRKNFEPDSEHVKAYETGYQRYRRLCALLPQAYRE